MVNYGYDCINWTEEEMMELAKELEVLCRKNPDKYNMFPYVEVNGLYEGVRIRRITHLPNNDNNQFEKKADKVYFKVCAKIGKK
jgi:hypothetical protein